MERRQLEYFVAVFEHQSFTRASDVLHVSQPALSRSIQALERELGMPLFRRNRGGVVPTDAADRILRRARRILSEFATLRGAAQASGAGVLGKPRIAMTSSTAQEPMTTIAAELLERHPGIRTVGVAVDNSAEAVASVVRGSCDAALVGQPDQPVGKGIRAEKLFVEELMVVVPPGSSLDVAGRITDTELRGLSFIAAPPNTAMRALLDRLVEEVDVRVVAEAAHRDAVPMMVGRGIGLAILPSTVREMVDRMGGRMRGFIPPVEIPVWVVVRADPSPAAKAFVETATQATRARR